MHSSRRAFALEEHHENPIDFCSQDSKHSNKTFKHLAIADPNVCPWNTVNFGSLFKLNEKENC